MSNLKYRENDTAIALLLHIAFNGKWISRFLILRSTLTALMVSF